mmetsp:Transcript_35818/g.36515  ORF Transcript_35818/g.36515 Transcript_35818/m.36515 type:complete len:279 (+) Transcript_35818:271-1107(+)|eukprot:CAMPEP_0182417374 /NCGR_PEP_ID=MMETSP1167-20130531/1835_1 /TAXON_ID=2988 /ORGANISM="Mallomonas Sp, Strain CCMP3275" /LENGTH=278 /DNA_ID=CAMNT_0024590891 /DNA_START=161 /DNA_END=997 /DNA_ORIENTATION=-
MKGSNEDMNNSWRTGKWTIEEEDYANVLIESFLNGHVRLLPEDGRTLRSFLARRLMCSPMRISKKFASLKWLGIRYEQSEFSEDKLIQHHERIRRHHDIFMENEKLVALRRPLHITNKDKHSNDTSTPSNTEASLIEQELSSHDGDLVSDYVQELQYTRDNNIDMIESSTHPLIGRKRKINIQDIKQGIDYSVSSNNTANKLLCSQPINTSVKADPMMILADAALYVRLMDKDELAEHEESMTCKVEASETDWNSSKQNTSIQLNYSTHSYEEICEPL